MPVPLASSLGPKGPVGPGALIPQDNASVANGGLYGADQVAPAYGPDVQYPATWHDQPGTPPPLSLNPNDPGYVPPAAPNAPTHHTGPSAADLAAGEAYGAANPPPEFMTPAMQQYVNQFHASQAAMQQSLNGSLAQALGGLKSRRDAASKVVATLPGQYDAAYTQATNAAQSAAHAAAGAFHGPTIGGSNGQRDIAAGNANARAAGKAAQPLLEAGITADYSKGATTLANTNMQNEAAWNDANTQFAAQMAHDQAQFDQASASQKQSIAADIARTTLASNLDLKNKEAQYKFELAHPQPLSASDRANLTASQNDAATKAGYTDFASEQSARNAATYYGQLLTGTGLDKGLIDSKSIKSNIEHDPNLRVAMQEKGYLVIDGTTGKITWKV